jgi:hypothetical protein
LPSGGFLRNEQEIVMKVQDPACVWKAEGITPTQRNLLLAIQMHCDAKTGVADVSLSMLEDMTLLNQSVIAMALSQLEGHYLARLPSRSKKRLICRMIEQRSTPDAKPVDARVPRGFGQSSMPSA